METIFVRSPEQFRVKSGEAWVLRRKMTVSETEEVIPLLDHGRRDDGGSDSRCSLLEFSQLQNVPNTSTQKSDDAIKRLPTRSACDFSDYGSRGPSSLLLPKVDSNQNITYSWSNLNVCDKPRLSTWKWIRREVRRTEFPAEQRRHILKNVCGIAHPGEFLAIMGSSGAGKTTLLNALTFQSGSGYTVKGSRYLNGTLINDRNTVARLSAYVEQENLFIGTLTVKEHLIFQSLIRIGRNVPYRQKLQRVEDVMTELGLEKCQNTIIGYPGRNKGISGGEMKRLSFASEVLTNPPIMFCDEPTSGLDSFMALNVINILKSMAVTGKTVICTIHQPSSEIFSVFDKILLLAEGRTAFLGDPQEAVSFFTELGAPPPLHYNPADFFIQLLAVAPNREDSCKNTIKLICDSFEQSLHGLKLSNPADTNCHNQAKTGGMLPNVWGSSQCVTELTKALMSELDHVTQRSSATYKLGPSSLYLDPSEDRAPQLYFFGMSTPEHVSTGSETPSAADCLLHGERSFERSREKSFEFFCKKLFRGNLNWRSAEQSSYPAAWCCQFKALLWRSWINIIKEPILVKVRLFQTVVLSVVVGLIYHRQNLNENGVMNINGVLFTFLTNMTFQNLFAVITVFSSELPLFLKENSNKLYRVDAYFLSKTLAEIPMFLTIPAIFTSITYYWIDLNPKFFHFTFAVLILMLVTNVATSFGYFLSCISTNVVMALSIGPPVVIPFLLFGGFLLNSGAVPDYFKWLSYFSWFKYGNEALLINQWSDVENIECNTSNVTCPRTGEIVLEIYHFQKENFFWDLGSLLILIILFRVLAFLALLFKTYSYQKA